MSLVSGLGEQKMKGRAAKLFTFNGLNREPVEEAMRGYRCSGYDSVNIGDTLTALADLTPLEYIDLDKPTIAMYFRVNNSPFLA